MTNVLDLFAGAGGWDIAARRLGIDPVGLELDDDCCATRKAAGLRTMQCDIAAVHLTPQCGWYPGRRGLIASPPCQGFSRAGKQKGLGDGHLIQTAMHHLAAGMDVREQLGAECADSRSMLVVEPLRWALALEPRWIALEQVPSVLPFWDLTAEILGTRGYNCWTGLLHAEQFGVPQTRKRAFLIASLDGPVGPPAPTHSKYHVRDPRRLDAGVLPWLSMAKALGWDDGIVNTRGNRRTSGGNEFPTSRPSIALTEKARSWKVQPTHLNPRQVTARPRPVDEPAPTLTGVGLSAGTACWDMDNERRDGTANDPQRITVKEAARLQSFPAWVHERPAPTVGTTHGGVAGRQRHGHVNLLPDEARALQSYPDGFPFQGSRTSQFRQIGNACPPAWMIPVLGEAMRVDWREAHAAYLEELYG